jgi:2-oxoglutarate ferredoxin oxidoreductase subunit gamma
MIVISDEEISSPYVQKADTLIAMNQPSLEKFIGRLSNKGLLILNSSLIRKKKIRHKRLLSFPFTDMAVDCQDIRSANMVALGCFIAFGKCFDIKKSAGVIEELIPLEKKNLIAINHRAFYNGVALVSEK